MLPFPVKSLRLLLEFAEVALEARTTYSQVRTQGVNPIFRKRRQQGDEHNLLNELSFDYLLELITPIIQKSATGVAVIPPSHRLAMTLRHLAVGDCYSTLSFSYRCGISTVTEIVHETIKAIIHALLNRAVEEPTTQKHWLFVANGFLRSTGLPMCLGALDGRLMRIKPPSLNGRNFYCYKKFHAIVFLALVASDRSFIIADIGREGSLSDSTVLKKSSFWNRVLDGSLNIPGPSKLPNSRTKMNYYFVGDRGFRLESNLLKPFHCKKLTHSQATLNFRISQARVVAEQAFGILVYRWRIFEKALPSDLQKANDIVLGCVCLHNFIIRRSSNLKEEEYLSMQDTVNKDDLLETFPVLKPGAGRGLVCGKDTRQTLLNYVCRSGAIANQGAAVKRSYWGSKVK